MTNPSVKINGDMKALRIEIDRVDTALLNLIAERMDLAAAVRRAKSGANVWRPSREESHVRDLARKAGITAPELVSHIWAELTSASLTLQGPIGLHIALVGDALSQWSLVRDRFGASIPAHTYPTTSAALAAAFADLEGVAVLPAPGGMNNWWTALGPDGAMSSMHILAALPRIGNWEWPIAVAVSKAAIEPSGDDITLIYIEAGTLAAPQTLAKIFESTGLSATLRAEMNGRYLYSMSGYFTDENSEIVQLSERVHALKIIGVLPSPIPLPRDS
ncbi:MAG: chorismate mutase [Robiginitomaculum sp.]|nr:chorismate mutase [Robiginitomaculum sp.]